MERWLIQLTTAFVAGVIGFNGMTFADNPAEDERGTDYLLAKEECNALPSDERNACRADAKVKYFAIIEHGTYVNAYTLYSGRLRLFSEIYCLRTGLR